MCFMTDGAAIDCLGACFFLGGMLRLVRSTNDFHDRGAVGGLSAHMIQPRCLPHVRMIALALLLAKNGSFHKGSCRLVNLCYFVRWVPNVIVVDRNLYLVDYGCKFEFVNHNLLVTPSVQVPNYR